MSDKQWYRGFVSLPCFSIVTERGTTEATFTCADWLVAVWRTIFKPFWRGGIYIYDEGEEDNA